MQQLVGIDANTGTPPDSGGSAQTNLNMYCGSMFYFPKASEWENRENDYAITAQKFEMERINIEGIPLLVLKRFDRDGNGSVKNKFSFLSGRISDLILEQVDYN